jgi:hypothetical protein
VEATPVPCDTGNPVSIFIFLLQRHRPKKWCPICCCQLLLGPLHQTLAGWKREILNPTPKENRMTKSKIPEPRRGFKRVRAAVIESSLARESATSNARRTCKSRSYVARERRRRRTSVPWRVATFGDRSSRSRLSSI